MSKAFLIRLLPLMAVAVCCGQGAAVDGLQVLRHAREIVRHGPHPPGSEAQRKVGQYLVRQLENLDLRVDTHTFRAVTPRGRLQMTNVRGILPGREERVLILASHYDSKFFDTFEFVGANDGASSSGLVLELARILAQDNPTGLTFWFLFFDGEEALGKWTTADSLYGSRAFVKREGELGNLRHVGAMILLDLVGGKDLRIFREGNSTPWMNRIIWKQASRLGHTRIFRPSGRTAIEDDHIPFIRAGIPAVDLIDLNYAHWHKPSDTLDKLSGPNLEVVGAVVLASLPEIAREVKRR
jgi:Zn-dependent M28 family amino/carboxypeptidase